MWFSRLFWKLFLTYAGLNLALAISFLVVGVNWQRNLAHEQARLRLHDSLVLLRAQLRDELTAAPSAELHRLLTSLSQQTGTELSLLGPEGEAWNGTTSSASARLPGLRLTRLPRAGYDTVTDPRTGSEVLVLQVPLADQGPPPGYLQAALNLEAINRPLDAMEQRLWMLTLVCGVLAVVVTYWVVGKIVRPLTNLTEGAQAIASGDDEHSVHVETGDELGLLGTAFNHMQRKLHRRLAQLRENSERLATVLGSMIEGVIAIDAEQNILLANEAGRTLLDFVTADAVGRPLLEVTRSRPVHDAVQTAFGSPEPVQREFEAPGAIRRVLSLRATRLPGEPCPGVMVVLHDITELRRLENLRQELVANVSHELKTPLASIKAYAETLRLGAINDPEHNLAFVGRIEEQAERLHQLILDLLQIARIETGQEAFDIQIVPVAEVVARCVQHYQDAADAKAIQLVIEPPPEPVSVLADDEGVLTILSNLVDNAIKYTPDRGAITVRWRPEGKMVVLEVQDTGLGIAPQDQGRVFERFYRVDKARSRELGGTGLGLSIVKHLAQAFHGSVGLQSRLRQGSTFRVSLPKA